MADSVIPLSRRQFLKRATAALLAALLSSCGRHAGPVPTKTPRRFTPGALSTSTSTATPTADAAAELESPLPTPQAQLIGEPPPSPTRGPRPTPTPPATPFPAGPPTKLGLFVAWFHPQIMDLVATRNVAVLKTLEFDPAFLADVRSRSPNTLIVGRTALEPLDLSRADAAVKARQALDSVLAMATDARRVGLVDAWEGFNEPVPGDEDEMKRLSDLEVERVRLLSDNGLRAVVGNFGTGFPPLEWWPVFRPALEAAHAGGGYLGLHEYSAPTLWYGTTRSALDFRADPADEGWLTLRYRKVYDQFLIPWGLRLPLVLTECGVDGGVQPRPGPAGSGWSDFGAYWNELGMGEDVPGNYIEQLAWYDGELQQNDYVRGAAIFAMTAFQGMQVFQLLGKPAQILQQYLSVHPVH